MCTMFVEVIIQFSGYQEDVQLHTLLEINFDKFDIKQSHVAHHFFAFHLYIFLHAILPKESYGSEKSLKFYRGKKIRYLNFNRYAEL